MSNSKSEYVLENKDIKKIYTRGSGPGGQHRNKVETCVMLTHIPTNISARIDGRRRSQNEKEALKILQQRVCEYYNSISDSNVVETRRNQIGTGSRGDKTRTYNTKNNKVVDHNTGKKCSLKKFMKGKIELLH